MGWIIFGVLAVAYIGALVVGTVIMKGEKFVMYYPELEWRFEVKSGFSLSYYFLGPIIPLLNGYVIGLFVTLVLEIITFGLARIPFSFLYNRFYISWLEKNGFQKMSSYGGDVYEAPAKENKIPFGDNRKNGFDAEPRKGDYIGMNQVIPPRDGVQNFGGFEEDEQTVDLKMGGIVGVSGQYEGASIDICGGERIILGRDGEQSNLVITEQGISRKHCEIAYDAYNRQYQVTDYSTNGVFLGNGVRLTKGMTTNLDPGTVIQLGNSVHRFRLK